MNNLEKWRYYLKDIIAPDDYINMSFYFIISASLQRRVWVGPEEMALFPNVYIILVGEPGTGKGLVIKPTTDVLRYHKKNPKLKDFTDKMAGELDADTLKEIQEAMAALSGAKLPSKVTDTEGLLIPIGSDAVTFEALTDQHKNAQSFIRTTKPSKILAPHGRYLHNSLAITLEEISTLFRKKAEDVVKYLLKAYDCGHFEYRTISRGLDAIRNPCLSILGGTTPAFLYDSFTHKLLDEGFASRALFVYAGKPRFDRFGIPNFTDEQLQCKQDIIDHVKKLTELFGQVTYTPEAFEYLRHYFEEVLPFKRRNDNIKLNSYYARKAANCQKLATIIHFADNTDNFEITLDECKLTLKTMDHLEGAMHMALSSEGDTEFSRNSSRILKYLINARKTAKNLEDESRTIREIWKSFPMKYMDLVEVLNYLESVKKVEPGKEKEKERTYKAALLPEDEMYD